MVMKLNGPKLALISTCILLIVGFLGAAGYCQLSAQQLASRSELEKLVKNFTYRLAHGSETYQLKNGQFESGKPLEDYINLRLETASFGDLNHDGQLDAAVILVANFGGSGSFYELTALLSKDNQWFQTNNLELGDRVQVKSLRVSRGLIYLDLLTHKPEDPMCCPSQRRSLRYQANNGVLEEVK
jgi:hypothetical protein